MAMSLLFDLLNLQCRQCDGPVWQGITEVFSDWTLAVCFFAASGAV
jgi:hypothetical protein